VPRVPRIVGVIPAAGHATRLQPLAGSKEVYPIAGRPVLDYLLERMRAVEGVELRVVTRPEKRDVVEAARARGAEVIEAEPPSVSESLLAGMTGLAGDDIVLLGFPDSLWEPVDGFTRLVERLKEAPVVLGLFESAEPERSDVVEVEEDGVIRRVHVKPAQPSGSTIWGCAAARAGGLAELGSHDQPGFLFDALARGGNVRGVRFPGEFLDIGTPAGLRRAQERCSR
jgi:glucose-1-phosphate thymidylyltransferase